VQALPLARTLALGNPARRSPRDQWWLGLRAVADRLARPAPAPPGDPSAAVSAASSR
jgi:hypothetical protein